MACPYCRSPNPVFVVNRLVMEKISAGSPHTDPTSPTPPTKVQGTTHVEEMSALHFMERYGGEELKIKSMVKQLEGPLEKLRGDMRAMEDHFKCGGGRGGGGDDFSAKDYFVESVRETGAIGDRIRQAVEELHTIAKAIRPVEFA